MKQPLRNQRMLIFLRHLSLRELRPTPKGVGLKTVIKGIELGYVFSPDEFPHEVYVLTQAGLDFRDSFSSKAHPRTSG